MFSKEFNTVYTEAFTAATQGDFTDAKTQQEYRDYTDTTAMALLARWHALDFDTSPITDRIFDHRAEAMHIKHPNTADFTAEEAYDIAHVRFLGRKIIDAARQALTENNGENLSFESWQWVEAHPGIEPNSLNDIEAHDIDAVSPQRLREWPHGDYVNCLGASIALAAESENEGITYAYINNLRSARYESSMRASEYFNYLWRMCEDSTHAKIDERIHDVDSACMEADGASAEAVQNAYDCIRRESFLGSLAIFTYGGIDTSFHHSVIREDAEYKNWWTQQDPFALVNAAPIVPSILAKAVKNDIAISDDGACNEILLLDGNLQELTANTMAQGVELAERSQRRIEEMVQQYKSPKMMTALFDELRSTRLLINAWSAADGNIVKQMSDKELVELGKKVTVDDSTFEKRMLAFWVSLLESITKDIRHEGKTVDDIMDDAFKAYEGDENIMHMLRGKVNEFTGGILQNDSALRKRFNKMMSAAPFAFALHTAEARINKGLVEDHCDKAMEVGDPAFQIGSMYINHYARWRKGDIINAAKELARINPSQLIWQSAVSRETGPVTESHVMALGALVKSLKIGQQHPLVRITHPPKE